MSRFHRGRSVNKLVAHIRGRCAPTTPRSSTTPTRVTLLPNAGANSSGALSGRPGSTFPRYTDRWPDSHPAAPRPLSVQETASGLQSHEAEHPNKEVRVDSTLVPVYNLSDQPGRGAFSMPTLGSLCLADSDGSRSRRHIHTAELFAQALTSLRAHPVRVASVRAAPG